MTAARDVMTYLDEIDVRAVWDTIKTDLPSFKKGVEKCLRELSAK